MALFDFGAKGSIAKELVERGCRVTVLPAFTTAEEVVALRPDGIMPQTARATPPETRASSRA